MFLELRECKARSNSVSEGAKDHKYSLFNTGGLLRRTEKMEAILMKAASFIGIILFVGIPLPTTGTWTAAAIASILRMRLIEALSGIFIGNILSGLIVSLLSYHIL